MSEITIFAISNLDDNVGKSVVGGQWLAIQQINNNPDLFPNYKLNFQVFDAHSDRQQALIYALNVTQHQNTMNETYFPIILGAPWSSLSTSIGPVLGAFNMGQFAVATSIALSETNKYPYFYRTVPSDTLQAEGIILLCNTFNWTSIAVVYVNDAYGLYLSLGIQSLATKYDIDVTGIAISEYEDLTYNYAAKQIQDLNVYIIVIIIHDNNVMDLFAEFKKQGILKYPYFFLGTDGWLDESVINVHNLTQLTAGFIGTVPWQTQSLSLDEYTEDVAVVVNQSIAKYESLLKEWRYYYNNGYAKHLYLETPGTFVIYGYDAMYTLSYAIQQIEDNHELYGGNLYELMHNGDSSKIIKILNNIIINKTNFIGTSGHVLFDHVGDRINGLYSLGNILSNGNIDYFGYFFLNIDGTITSKLNRSKIVWPKHFTEKGIIPRTETLIYNEIKTINSSTFMIMFILSCLSILLAVIFILLLICCRNNKVIRAATWRLNVIMCIGAIIGYIAVILYGIDERERGQNKLDTFCNIRFWMESISFTILFMPLFAKTYRLSRMFKNILRGKTLNDKQLLLLVACCVLIDVLLLLMFILINPLKRVYFDGSLEAVDELQQIQYIYGACSFVGKSNDALTSMYAIALLWKLCELGFGVYAALNVSRIRDVTNLLTKFDETGIQLMSILLTVVIFCIAMTILLINDLYGNSYYLVISVTILLIGNIVLWLNLMPRILAVLTRNEDEYQQSPAQRIESRIKQELRRFSVGSRANLL